MTNEEIIQQLELLKSLCLGTEYVHTTIIKGARKSSVIFVLSMAIKALRKEEDNDE